MLCTAMSFAADLGQRHVKDDVALGLDDVQFHRKAGMYGFEAVLHMVRLPEGQTAATGGDNEFFHNDPWLVNTVPF